MANEHFFPPIEPYDTGTLAVDDPHRLYYEQCGNPTGEPMLFLHGGPGAGCIASELKSIQEIPGLTAGSSIRITSVWCCWISAAVADRFQSAI